jgi:hypothetical protein
MVVVTYHRALEVPEFWLFYVSVYWIRILILQLRS